jgi:glycopeptide antibiotics resistance protein
VIVTRLWHHFHQVWLYVALLIPVAVLLTAVLARLRPSRSWDRSIAEVGMVFGTLPWVWMILTPLRLPPNSVTVYLIPLSDLWHERDPLQIVGNLLVLFAFGAFAPVRFPWLRGLTRLAVLGLALAFALEVLQHLFVAGRVFSVDDVWLNALGCVLGGLVTRRRWRPDPATTSV